MSPDYRLFFDHQALKAVHLQGKSVVLTIASVERGEMKGEGGRKDRMPFVKFEGKELPLGLNRTNSKTIAALYGNDTSDWVGKRIELYPTTTKFGAETKDCIRVKPAVPK